MIEKNKKIILMLIDGWGIAPDGDANAFYRAKTPVLETLMAKYPSAVLSIRNTIYSRETISPSATNSYLSLATGRSIEGRRKMINRSIKDKSFYHNNVLQSLVQHSLKYNSKLHLIGLLGEANKHSSLEHLKALTLFAKRSGVKKLFFHFFLDGIDSPHDSGAKTLASFQKYLIEKNLGQIATVAGTFYGMDDKRHWNRTKKVYDAMVHGEGKKVDDLRAEIQSSYQKKIFDAEMSPCILRGVDGSIGDNDAVFSFNHSFAGMRQIMEALLVPSFRKFDGIKRIQNIYGAGFAIPDRSIPAVSIFMNIEKKIPLGNILMDHGIYQDYIASEEGYLQLSNFVSEELIPNKKIKVTIFKSNRDSITAMIKKAIEAINDSKISFVCVALSQIDKAAHEGNIDKVVEQIEELDNSLPKMISTVNDLDILLLFTAPYGNAEQMENFKSGEKHIEHTGNNVPLLIIGNNLEGRNLGSLNASDAGLATQPSSGTLADIVPTILDLFGIEKPREMEGESLIN